MKVLVIGSGGREHAIAWKIAQSSKVKKIWVSPGNGGTAAEKKVLNLPLDSDPASEEGQKALLDFAYKEKIDLTVVGPELPLAAGIVDRFRAAKLIIAGPDKKAAALEASKVYSNSFMTRYGVRAPARREFSDAAAAQKYVNEYFGGKNKTGAEPVVIKADGLAAGKGVVITDSAEGANDCVLSFMNNNLLGEAGKKIVFEQFLDGQEVSILAAVSVKNGAGTIKPFLPARDHKSRFENGKGPNTGGMGAVAPVPDFTINMYRDFREAVLLPTLKGLIAEKIDYRGFIFFGLMVKDGQCYLLEYNVRLGDPETQALLPLMESDFTELCLSMVNGGLQSFELKWMNRASCAPVVVVEGYPGSFPKGTPVAVNSMGLGRTGAKIFVAGAQRGEGGALGSGLRVTGGRVLAVSASGKNAAEARTKAYDALRFVDFEGMAYRKDIGLVSSHG